MDKIVGVVIGLCVFAAVLVGGMMGGSEASTVLRNALLLGWVGFVAGWFLWGKLGLSIASYHEKEAPVPNPSPEEPAKKK